MLNWNNRNIVIWTNIAIKMNRVESIVRVTGEK
jgi:hypothetical protein